MRVFFQFFCLFAIIALSWLLGARLGAPEPILNLFNRVTDAGLEKSSEIGTGLIEELDAGSTEVIGNLRHFTDELVARFDEDPQYIEAVITSPSGSISQTETPVATQTPEPIEPAPQAALFTGDTTMMVCATQVSNAPPTDSAQNIRNFKPLIDINGTPLLAAPVTKSCLSSGYGPRGSSGKLHKGVDYYTKENGDVIAAGNGTIIEALYRDDYGYMVVIDHGNNVYTRYAHLKRFASGLAAGQSISQGAQLGPIGNSGAYTSVAHLHYEILLGDYDTPKKSFGLTPRDPYSFPAAN